MDVMINARKWTQVEFISAKETPVRSRIQIYLRIISIRRLNFSKHSKRYYVKSYVPSKERKSILMCFPRNEEPHFLALLQMAI